MHKGQIACSNADEHTSLRKICLVSAYPPSNTTLNEYGLHLAEAIVRADQVTDLVVLADQISQAGPPEKSRVMVDRCWSFNSFLTPFRILKKVRRHKPDVVIFNSHMGSFGDREVSAAMGLLTVPLLRLFGYRTGVILHNVLGGVNLEHTSMKGRPIRQALVSLFGQAILRLLLTSNYLTVTLREYRDLLARAGSVSHVFAVAHGSFETSREIDYPALQARPRRIVTFGKFGTYKKLDNLISAVKKLRSMPGFADVELVIGGGNHQSAKHYIEKTLSDLSVDSGIIYVGYVAEDEVPNFFHSAVVTVFDYAATTGSSGALNQAVSYGSVPIFPQIEDFTRVCKDEGIEGLNFVPGCVDQIVEHILNVLEDPASYQNLVDKNFSSNRAFTIDDVARFHIDKTKKLKKGGTLQNLDEEACAVNRNVSQ